MKKILSQDEIALAIQYYLAAQDFRVDYVQFVAGSKNIRAEVSVKPAEQEEEKSNG